MNKNHHQLGTEKFHKVFWLYQNMPRGEDKAKTLSELAEAFETACTTANLSAGKRVKANVQNAINALYEVIGDNLCRLPSWDVDDISGVTARFYINPNFYLEETIDPQTVLLWQMVSQYTTHFLPAPIRQAITEKLAVVKAKHSKQHKTFANNPLANWQHRIIALPNVLQAPKLDEAILAKLHTALLEGKSIRMSYRKKWHDKPQSRQVHPVGLVVVDNLLYLTGFNPCEEHIDNEMLLKHHRNFALPRILDVEVLEENVPDWLNRDELSLQALYDTGKLEPHGDEQTIRLKLRIQNYACKHLYERPLSDDQTIKPIMNDDGTDSGWSCVTATVANTIRLQDWLVSMSQLAVVVEPVEVREAVLRRLKQGIEIYQH